jgi:ubiquitin C-terminal hydrolase
LDLSLTIRAEDADKVVNPDLVEAIYYFLRTEELKGDNRYACDRCKRKTDALKG